MQSRARRRGPRTAGPSLAGLGAGAAVAVLALAMLLKFSTVSETGRFVVFCVLGITLPGFALWRLIGSYRRNLVEDCAAGFAVGTAAQIIVYLASSSVGFQQWSWVWAPIVLVITFLDREVRSRVWCRVEEPLRPLQAWMLAAACAIVLIVVFVKGPMEFLPAYTDPLRSYPDLAFQQALAASAKYDVPIATLWLGGEPMKYHTFFHQSTAATAWATRIDLTDLIHSLTWLPLLLAGCALVFALTQRFMGTTPEGDRRVGTTWAGPLAVLVAGLGGAIQPLPDLGLGGISTAVAAYLSPTQNLGVLVTLVICLVAVDLLRGQPPRSRWVLLIGLTLIAAGAKSTILPLAGFGFGLAFVFQVMARRKSGTALWAGALCLTVFLGALVLIFGGESWGTKLKPFETFVQLSPYSALRNGDGVDGKAQLLTALTTLLSWGLASIGVLFLGRRWRDPGVVFLAGLSLAGLAFTLVTTQSGISQLYFLRTAFPVIAVLACVGLANLVARLGDQRSAVLVGVSGLLGLAACAGARVGAEDLKGVKGPWVWTVAALAATGLLVAVGWKLARRRGGLLTAFVVGVAAAAMVGATLVPLQAVVSDHASALVFAKPGRGGATAPEAGAARWLRRNSKPGELVATNAHCIIQREEICDSRHFWIAALSERPVLVEGWSYSNQANRISVRTGVNPSLLPYWDEQELAANDAAFTAPSAAVIERLRRIGVRWLYADNRAGQVAPNLKSFVRLRHATLDATIYELR
ncbi:hypothetical protein GCM10009789_51180 [Kribbella sancticallisti]|uniref:4-amino-4-deoxy-L-arabinose transferase n=1 Tax=Kribbella sancticallisti TaxID=460087 RepID=A0ABN2E273_9ACTN